MNDEMKCHKDSQLLTPETGGREQKAEDIPLVVDLDGTLVATDLFWESLIVLLKENPFAIFAAFFWLLRGKAYLKKQVGRKVSLEASLLPYNPELLAYLRDEHCRKRRLVLATATDERIARSVAAHLGLFERVFASDGKTNLSGISKKNRLITEWGEKNFDYAGNERRDLAVWAAARKAILVNPSPRLIRRVSDMVEIDRVFREREGWFLPLLQAFRLSHWVKNLLVLVPLALVQKFTRPDLLANALLAFLAFSFCASTVYLINDMTDLAADRRHPAKRLRPFAAGTLPLSRGLIALPLLLSSSFALGSLLPEPFLIMIAIYLVLNLIYSFSLKQFPIMDVTLLAILYTMRIMAGAAAISIQPSDWLLAFSAFLFLSLALVKRFDELVVMRGLQGDTAQVRGYRVADQALLSSLGAVSGYIAVLVLVIYISSGAARVHYRHYHLIWFLCPLLLYWISYIWLIAHRSEMTDDPLVFTMGNKTSRIVMLLAAAVVLLAM